MMETQRRADDPDLESGQGSSDRVFGLVIGGFFLVLFLLSLRRPSPLAWLLASALAFSLAALFFPRLLGPLNRGWTWFGLQLHRVVSPVALAVVFFLCVMPTGLLMRLFGKDPLRLRFDPSADSYWVERKPAGPDAESLKNQF